MVLGLLMIASIMIRTSHEPVGNQRASRVRRAWCNQSEAFGKLLSGTQLSVNERMSPNCIKRLQLHFWIVEAFPDIERLSQCRSGSFILHTCVVLHQPEARQKLGPELWV